MLKAYPADCGDNLDDAIWVDLEEPTEEEVARIRERYGLTVPSREALAEIEASSRLRVAQDALYMSAPLMTRREDNYDILTPAGFILGKDVLVTVRFADFGAFEVIHEMMGRGERPTSPAETLVRLLEEIVDRAADRLERAAATINDASHAVFSESHARHRMRLGRETRRLRGLMMQAGWTSEQMVRVRHSVMAIARIAGFLTDRCEPKLEDALLDRLASIGHDIESLDQFEESLSGRVQLILDAATGFLSIEQNDVVKVLTVVSVAGVPPVLVVGVYGMNFKYMPELAWPWGYPFALVLMVVTTVLPILWFKWRDWL